MKQAALYSLFILFSAVWSQADGYREFTSTSGQTMQAKPVNIVGKQIRIERSDGMEFNVSIDRFSKKDQKFLREWMLTKLAEDGRLLSVEAKEDGTRKEKTGKSSTSSIVYKHWDGFYKLVIENESEISLNKLRIEYRYYIFDDAIAADKRSEGDTKVTKGELKLEHLGPYKTVELETEKTPMQESELGSGWYYAGGGDRGSKDKLEGIRMKIYQGDLLLYDYCEPTNLRKKYRW